MANIKLKDHYWETEGIYDVAQSKTQKAINADIEEVAQNNSDLIIMSDTQPSATGNKIWIKEGVSYQIPVMDDLISNNITNNSSVTGTKVTDALNTLGTNVNSLQSSLIDVTPFDTTPISGSTKGVTSGGVYNALANIGTTQTGSVVTNDIPYDTDTNINTLTLSKGTYLITALVSLYAVPANILIQSSIKQVNDILSAIRYVTAGSNTNRMALTAITVITDPSKVINVSVYHNANAVISSGSTLTAIKLK